MAIYSNYNQINSYMKIGSTKDFCWICAKKINDENKKDIYETFRDLEGKVENKPVLFIRRSAIDTCICMNCIEEIYNNHIKKTSPKDEVIKDDEVITENEENKKSNKTKKDK